MGFLSPPDPPQPTPPPRLDRDTENPEDAIRRRRQMDQTRQGRSDFMVDLMIPTDTKSGQGLFIPGGNNA